MTLSAQQEKIASAFPELKWSLVDRVGIYRPEGTLNPGIIARLAQWLHEVETDLGQPFNRFNDLTKLERIDVSRLDLANVAFWRRATYSGPQLKSAFLARSEEAVGLAKAYQSFMEGSLIQVAVFTDIEAAADWLGVPVATLAE